MPIIEEIVADLFSENVNNALDALAMRLAVPPFIQSKIRAFDAADRERFWRAWFAARRAREKPVD